MENDASIRGKFAAVTANGKPSRMAISLTNAHDEGNEGKRCVLYRGAVDWVFYIFCARPTGRPAAARRARSPARPEDPTKAAYWPSVTSAGSSSQMFRRHKSLDPHKGLLRFTEFLPSFPGPMHLAREFFFATPRLGLRRPVFDGSLIFHCVNMAGGGVIIPALFRARALYRAKPGNCLSMVRTSSG